MPAFQITSRRVQMQGSIRKRPTRMQRQWNAVLRVVIAVVILGLLTLLFKNIGLSLWIFVLLPVSVSIIVARSQLYNRKTLLLATILALIYFAGITALQLLIHSPSTPEIIVVTTTLVMAVLFEPVRVRVQLFFEQRFHLRNDEAIRIIEAFNKALREEIGLNQVRERFLAVIQKTMQPQSLSLWVSRTLQEEETRLTQSLGRKSSRQLQSEEASPSKVEGATKDWLYTTETSEVTISSQDPFLKFALRSPGAEEIDKLPPDSSLSQTLKADGEEIVLPLVNQGELLGLLTLGPHLSGEEYTREDYNLLNMLTAQVASALRVVQMVQEQQAQVRERERIEQELWTAQNIQHTFLPKEVPALPGWHLVPYYQSAREVGGDFYDFIPIPDGRLALVIGDVADKGIPAALVMTATRTMLRATAMEKTSPGEVLARVNDLLYADTPSGMFVTCFYALLDPKSGRMCYANAGHELPYRCCESNFSELRATGMPLGMLPGSRYEEHEVVLAPGETLLFYSDGLIEAHNEKREMFGVSRLIDAIKAHLEGTELIDALLNQLAVFTGDEWEQEDDVTIVVLHKMSVSQPQHPTPEKELFHLLTQWTMPSIPDSERLAVERLEAALQPLQLSTQQLERIKTATAEAAMNAMEHGNQYRPDKIVTFQVLTSTDSLLIRVRDQGEGQFCPIDIPQTPDLGAKLSGQELPRGWGLFLIQQLVDKLNVVNGDHSHTIELTIRLKKEEESQ